MPSQECIREILANGRPMTARQRLVRIMMEIERHELTDYAARILERSFGESDPFTLTESDARQFCVHMMEFITRQFVAESSANLQ